MWPPWRAHPAGGEFHSVSTTSGSEPSSTSSLASSKLRVRRFVQGRCPVADVDVEPEIDEQPDRVATAERGGTSNKVVALLERRPEKLRIGHKSGVDGAAMTGEAGCAAYGFSPTGSAIVSTQASFFRVCPRSPHWATESPPYPSKPSGAPPPTGERPVGSGYCPQGEQQPSL